MHREMYVRLCAMSKNACNMLRVALDAGVGGGSYFNAVNKSPANYFIQIVYFMYVQSAYLII